MNLKEDIAFLLSAHERCGWTIDRAVKFLLAKRRGKGGARQDFEDNRNAERVVIDTCLLQHLEREQARPAPPADVLEARECMRQYGSQPVNYETSPPLSEYLKAMATLARYAMSQLENK